MNLLNEFIASFLLLYATFLSLLSSDLLVTRDVRQPEKNITHKEYLNILELGILSAFSDLPICFWLMTEKEGKPGGQHNCQVARRYTLTGYLK